MVTQEERDRVDTAKHLDFARYDYVLTGEYRRPKLGDLIAASSSTRPDDMAHGDDLSVPLLVTEREMAMHVYALEDHHILRAVPKLVVPWSDPNSSGGGYQDKTVADCDAKFHQFDDLIWRKTCPKCGGEMSGVVTVLKGVASGVDVSLRCMACDYERQANKAEAPVLIEEHRRTVHGTSHTDTARRIAARRQAEANDHARELEVAEQRKKLLAMMCERCGVSAKLDWGICECCADELARRWARRNMLSGGVSS